jgi:hypothetical protein
VKNKLADLNNHLFAQLERLGDEALEPDAVDREVKRADAIVGVSEQIVRNAALQLKAAELVATHGFKIKDNMPVALENKSKTVNGTSERKDEDHDHRNN